MKYPDFARVPLAIIAAGLVLGVICQHVSQATPWYLVAGLIWFGMLVYVCLGLLKPGWFAQ